MRYEASVRGMYMRSDVSVGVHEHVAEDPDVGSSLHHPKTDF